MAHLKQDPSGNWIVIETGKPARPDQVKALQDRLSNAHVNTPAEALSRLNPSTIGSNLAQWGKGNALPILSQMGGEEVGALGGTALGGPLGGILGGAAGAGLGGLGSKYLPEKYGGDPKESKLRAFGIPALVGGAGRAVSTGVEGAVAKRTEATIKAQREEFAKLQESSSKLLSHQIGENFLPRVPEQNVLEIQRRTGFDPYEQEVVTPKAKEETTNAKNAILGPIDRIRQKYGQPIGNAYSQLKGEGSISVGEAGDLAEAAKDVQETWLAPAPKAAAVVNKLKAMGPPDLESIARAHPDWTPEQVQAVEDKYKPPTVDELRELRQGVNEALRNSGNGGDIHALGDLQQALDEHLLPRLPANMKAMQSDYAHYIQNYSWKDVRALRQSGNVPALADWMFGKKAYQTIDMVKKASRGELSEYQRLYTSRLFRGIDPDDPPEVQVEQLHKNSRQDRDLIKALYHNDNPKAILDLINYPTRIKQAGEIWKRPEVQRAWTEAFMRETAIAPTTNKMAAEDAFQDMLAGLSPRDRQAFVDALPHGIKLPGQAEPVLLPSKEAMVKKGIEGWTNQSSGMARRMSFAVPWGIGSLVFLGRPSGYAMGIISLGVATGGLKAGTRWAINHGVGDIMSEAALAMSRNKPQLAAKLVFSALTKVGAQAYRSHKSATP